MGERRGARRAPLQGGGGVSGGGVSGGGLNAVPFFTPYEQVNAVLQHFAERIRGILGGQFLGMYLYGSLALGDFDPYSSDIDFIVVTKDEMADELYTSLVEMHEQFEAGGSPWAARIEAAYIPQAALQHSAATQAVYPQVEKGTKLFKAPLEPGWAFQLYSLRERGVVLSGPEPRTICAPVDPGSMRRAAAAIAEDWQKRAGQEADWLKWVRRREAQSFVVLTLCRMLYSLESGDVASKPAAARWAKKALDPLWAPLIDGALAGQHAPGEASEREVEDTLAFIGCTVEKCQRKEGDQAGKGQDQ